ncbi:MAG: hypothetical protein UW39_C0010G0016 [Parcubacteria group bacterium GW2011_GWC2_44_17]|uniref:Uncharacterized protein n=1 Tax=Candidatus Jacksonbacteria bacterium RIFCSPLOWO2_02_FULL_44_20 TaxID=1798460 RepID=A0A1G2AAB4_9BACT|nr:MAG: hypothetical protein UW39_C0010G0016 [Parcubacteria group bacterium GW2011_GWC2_44_17]OGY69602.1 MAG: hypothetical protein A3C00_02235 [Candidatus Jacksonbacteria bacterium RIFCSPHIGHO2_02_FULL_44_25]OGY73436.1 MAG: hypothetical protein A3H61_04775 [Candidatus Jacksonbacteria bacterium RIFCSPLOWO2_02_FULL_44_20]
MGDQLSDRQLAIASWMYERRLVLERIVRVFLGVCMFGLFGAIVVNTVLYISSYQAHRIQILSGTQNAILSGDPALLASPRSLTASEITAIIRGERSADLYSSINNPNASWAVFSVRYYFSSRGAPITEPRETFALPGENSVVGFANGAEFSAPFELILEDIKWRKIILPIERERLKLFSIESRDVVFTPGDIESASSSVLATLVNKSPFGFWNAPITAILYNNNSLVGIGEYTLSQFAAGEERAVLIGVGNIRFPVTNVEIVPRVNMLDDGSLML